jgi:hypothetical protein
MALDRAVLVAGSVGCDAGLTVGYRQIAKLKPWRASFSYFFLSNL